MKDLEGDFLKYLERCDWSGGQEELLSPGDLSGESAALKRLPKNM
jgi:hypothetical protein